MWNRHNVHKMFIRVSTNPKNAKFTKLVQVRNFNYLFEFKGFSTWRERDTIFLCWLLLHSQLSIQPSAQNMSCLPQVLISTFSFGGKSSTKWLFPNLKNPRFRAWYHSRPWSNFQPGFFIVTSLIVTSAPRAREHLHSTNPCTNLPMN